VHDELHRSRMDINMVPFLTLLLAMLSDSASRENVMKLRRQIMSPVRLSWILNTPVPIPLVIWPDGWRLVRLEGRELMKAYKTPVDNFGFPARVILAMEPPGGPRSSVLVWDPEVDIFLPLGSQGSSEASPKHYLPQDEKPKLLWAFSQMPEFDSYMSGVLLSQKGEPIILSDTRMDDIEDHGRVVDSVIEEFNINTLNPDLGSHLFRRDRIKSEINKFREELDLPIRRTMASTQEFRLKHPWIGGFGISIRGVPTVKLWLRQDDGSSDTRKNKLSWRAYNLVRAHDEIVVSSKSIIPLLVELGAIARASTYQPKDLEPGFLVLPPRLWLAPSEEFATALGIPGGE